MGQFIHMRTVLTSPWNIMTSAQQEISELRTSLLKYLENTEIAFNAAQHDQQKPQESNYSHHRYLLFSQFIHNTKYSQPFQYEKTKKKTLQFSHAFVRALWNLLPETCWRSSITPFNHCQFQIVYCSLLTQHLIYLHRCDLLACVAILDIFFTMSIPVISEEKFFLFSK